MKKAGSRILIITFGIMAAMGDFFSSKFATSSMEVCSGIWNTPDDGIRGKSWKNSGKPGVR